MTVFYVDTLYYIIYIVKYSRDLHSARSVSQSQTAILSIHDLSCFQRDERWSLTVG